ncbi:site-specific integrase [Luteimonas sp. 100069]|uniref:site-specific integrase n=1 Tax=Luteimonas sp. 100069 TaxID=2006109 RepID=UPI000F5086E0|nr:site-specific integrase [Luteimonas sp. 100069]
MSYTANEKRKRKKFGFKAFTREEVGILFAPENFGTLPLHTRWPCLLGLYTGARVPEIGQLRVLDVMELAGVPCLSFSDEGEHQSLKSVSSRRVVPIHPRLLDLGFLDYVKTMVLQNGRDLFPNGKEDAVNGRGSWITKAMGNYLAKVGPGWPKAKRGFHSFRKSVKSCEGQVSRLKCARSLWAMSSMTSTTRFTPASSPRARSRVACAQRSSRRLD